MVRTCIIIHLNGNIENIKEREKCYGLVGNSWRSLPSDGNKVIRL